MPISALQPAPESLTLASARQFPVKSLLPPRFQIQSPTELCRFSVCVPYIPQLGKSHFFRRRFDLPFSAGILFRSVGGPGVPS